VAGLTADLPDGADDRDRAPGEGELDRAAGQAQVVTDEGGLALLGMGRSPAFR